MSPIGPIALLGVMVRAGLQGTAGATPPCQKQILRYRHPSEERKGGAGPFGPKGPNQRTGVPGSYTAAGIIITALWMIVLPEF